MNVIRICDFLRPLVASGVGPYVEVRPARSLEAELQDVEGELPLCLVHPWAEKARPNRYDNFVQQRSDETFAVITICPITDLEPLRQALDAALLGKVLPTYVHEIQAAEGEVLHITATFIWWRDIYTTSRERRQQT